MSKTTEKAKYSDLLTTLIAQDILTSSSSQPIYLSSVEVIGGETFSSDFSSEMLTGSDLSLSFSEISKDLS